jgi:hypothetical protein
MRCRCPRRRARAGRHFGVSKAAHVPAECAGKVRRPRHIGRNKTGVFPRLLEVEKTTACMTFLWFGAWFQEIRDIPRQRITDCMLLFLYTLDVNWLSSVRPVGSENWRPEVYHISVGFFFLLWSCDEVIQVHSQHLQYFSYKTRYAQLSNQHFMFLPCRSFRLAFLRYFELLIKALVIDGRAW